MGMDLEFLKMKRREDRKVGRKRCVGEEHRGSWRLDVTLGAS